MGKGLYFPQVAICPIFVILIIVKQLWMFFMAEDKKEKAMSESVLIELFTLDSKGCAACTYTKKIVEDIIDKVAFDLQIVEYPIKR